MAKQAKSINKVVASSGNVFADLGLSGAAELDTKVRLAVAVNRLLESRRLTQAAAGTALSINQPKISALKHYKLEGFSIERLMTFLTALGSDIEIRVHLPERSRCLRGSGGGGVRSGDAKTLMDYAACKGFPGFALVHDVHYNSMCPR
jgi:predicted XRE-type DNA-binding protein